MNTLYHIEDNSKKGNFILISLFIIFSFLANKLFGPFHGLLLNPLVLPIFYSVLSVCSFVVAMSFRLNLRIIFLILPNLALIVFSQMFFVQMFFEHSFGRVYEGILLFIILLFISIVIYISFLTCNVFAVSSFRKLPLEAVAKTSIYFLTVLAIFFLTYSFLSLDLSLFILTPVLFLLYLLCIIYLLLYFYAEFKAVSLNAFLIFWNLVLIFVGSIIFSTRVEVVALLVVIAFYYAAGIFVEKERKSLGGKFLEYLIVLFLAISVSFYFSFF